MHSVGPGDAMNLDLLIDSIVHQTTVLIAYAGQAVLDSDPEEEKGGW
jgi:hypothetical protein